MEIFNKISAMTKSTVDKTSNKVTIAKINARIKSLQADINRWKQKIGEFYWERFKDNEVYEEGIADVFVTVGKLSSQVASAEAEINAILESERVAEPASAFSKPLVPVAECPSCGVPNDTDSKFCSSCGSSMVVISGKECTKCGAGVAVDASFCAECGAHLTAPEGLVCAQCGNAVSEDVKFCMNCGAKREPQEIPAEEPEAD